MDIIKNSDINFLSSNYEYASDKKDNSIYFTRDDVGSIIVNGKIYGQSNYTNISYDKLVNLRNNSALQTGVLYRITDYVTTTSQEGTKSAGIPFDIIVIATSNNTLSEDAKAVHHDSYFNNEKVDSWEIKYCLDNDNTRFGWADITNGKGVIYYMKDEFNNEAWYDFKNIQFLRTSSWFKENPNFPTQFTENKYFYTFSAVNNGVITDDSLYSTNYHATDNHLGRNTSKITKLNNTIFIDKVNNGVFNNIITDGHGNNTFGQSVWNNTIGHNFSNNVIYTSFQYNNISPNFTNNKVKDNFVYNEIGAGFTYNELNGKVMRTIFKPVFSGNKLNGSLTYCTFGSNNNYVTDFPSMTNVTISNQCFNGTSESKISLSNLFTSNGWNLLTTINGFNTEIEYTILSCANGKYDIFSHSTFDKISNIYDLGSFETSGDAEVAAQNTNISANANYSVLKYYVPSLNKTGIIEQIVGQSSTKQIITWDGTRKVRTLEFLNIGGNISLSNITSWEELKILTVAEWNNTNNKIKEVKENLISPIYSNPNLDFVDTSNNANCYGYVGTLKNINTNGDLILIDSIAVYVRENGDSPNLDTPVWCRLLRFVNDTWEVVYQSIESKTINGIAPETLFPFKMKAINEQNKLIKSTDKIAIVYADAEDADVLSCVQLGFKAIVNVGGALQNPLLNTSTGRHDYCPAFVVGYLSMAGDTSNIVTTNTTQSISGEKTFTSNININEKDIIISGDTRIRGDIDGGELKVFDERTANKGFTIRTESTAFKGLYPIQILATNNSKSVQYSLPLKDIQGYDFPYNTNIRLITERDIVESGKQNPGISYISDIYNYKKHDDLPGTYYSTSLSIFGAREMYNDLTTLYNTSYNKIVNEVKDITNEITVINYDISLYKKEIDNMVNNISYISYTQEQNEEVTAIALVDLDERISYVSYYQEYLINNNIADNITTISYNFNNYKKEIDKSIDNLTTRISYCEESIINTEEIITAAIIDLNDRMVNLENIITQMLNNN